MKDHLVSVVIPNYNYAHYLRDAVDSVLQQTYPRIEVIVVDDGSTDQSREVIESYGSNIRALFQRNQGVSAARNSALSETRGDFVAFLDADDQWEPEKIERQMELFAADIEIGMVHVGVVEIDANGNSLLERTDGKAGWVSDELLRFNRPVILGGGSGIMLRRSVFDAVGGFDTRLSTSADWDLFYQVSRRFKVGFIPDILLRYRVHGSNMHGNIRAMEHDMMLGYEKAFANGATADRHECYGNLHRTLAGSYFVAGNYSRSVRHALKSIWNRPTNLGYFLKFPIRRLLRTK